MQYDVVNTIHKVDRFKNIVGKSCCVVEDARRGCKPVVDYRAARVSSHGLQFIYMQTNRRARWMDIVNHMYMLVYIECVFCGGHGRWNG